MAAATSPLLSLLLLAYATFTTVVIVIFRGKAVRYDELKADYDVQAEARLVEQQTYYRNNQAWQKEVAELKSLINELELTNRSLRSKKS